MRDRLLANSSREDFCRLASGVMRNVLVDHARARKAAKRGEGWERVTLSATPGEDPSAIVNVLALHEALTELAAMDERMAKLVELRFFGGLSEAETAVSLGVSRSVVTRDWRMARAWLAHKLRGDETRARAASGLAVAVRGRADGRAPASGGRGHGPRGRVRLCWREDGDGPPPVPRSLRCEPLPAPSTPVAPALTDNSVQFI